MPAAINTVEQPRSSPSTLADVLDRILHRGVSVDGNLTIAVAEVDLLHLDLRLLLASINSIWPEGPPPLSVAPSPMTEANPPVAPRPPSPVPPDRAPPDRVPTSGSTDTGHVAAGVGAVAEPRRGQPPSAESSANGLVRLVLTLVKLLHDTLERQAVRRMSGGKLTPAQIENVGVALLAQTLEIERLRQQFGFSDRDLTLRLDLHPSEGTT